MFIALGFNKQIDIILIICYPIMALDLQEDCWINLDKGLIMTNNYFFISQTKYFFKVFWLDFLSSIDIYVK